MSNAEGVAGARDLQDAPEARGQRTGEGPGLGEGHRFVGRAVREEDRHPEASASRGHVEPGAVPLEVLEHREVQAQLLPRARVPDGQRTALASDAYRGEPESAANRSRRASA